MATPSRVVLEARRVVKTYAGRGALWRRHRERCVAVAGVSVALAEGEIYGLVGRSGAGKSTLARMLATLEQPDSGEVLFGAERIDHLPDRALRSWRRQVQVVFQDATASLSPLQRVVGAVAEPLAVHGIVPRPARRQRVAELLGSVGLATDERFLSLRPRRLSGGERQRLAIARALACQPRVLLLDEPVSALDVSVRGQVLNLLLDLRGRLGLAMLLIAHDLRMVARVCDRVAVMLAGRLVEEGATDDVLGHPQHPYTLALLEASQLLPGQGMAEDVIAGEAGQPAGACPWFFCCLRAQEVCRAHPELAARCDNHAVACYFPAGL